MISKHTPLFFRKLPVTETSPSNSSYSRFMGVLAKGEAHEIDFHGEKWLVGRRDFWTREEGLAEIAKTYNDQITKAKELHKPETLKALAECLGWGETTLRNRMRLVMHHLNKPTT